MANFVDIALFVYATCARRHAPNVYFLAGEFWMTLKSTQCDRDFLRGLSLKLRVVNSEVRCFILDFSEIFVKVWRFSLVLTLSNFKRKSGGRMLYILDCYIIGSDDIWGFYMPWLILFLYFPRLCLKPHSAICLAEYIYSASYSVAGYLYLWISEAVLFSYNFAFSMAILLSPWPEIRRIVT